MDATTKKLCSMLKAEDPELQVAAARVLGELGPTEPPVLAALSAELSAGFGLAQAYALRALAASPVPEAVEYLFPALSGSAELRQQALEAIARFGPNAVPFLKDAVLGSDLELRKAAASALARAGGKAAHDLLLRALAEGNLDLSKHICFEVGHAIQQMAEKERAALAALVHRYLGRKDVKARETALASGLILLGFLGSPGSKAVLLGFARPSQAPEVRRRALLALRGIARELTGAELASLAACLEEDDQANVVRPVADLLRPLDLPPAAASRLIRLVASPHQAVRDFAVFKMGRLDTPEAAKVLINLLEAPQPALRELALTSLQRNHAAVPLLLKRLKTETDPGRLWAIARVLDHHAEAISAAAAKPFIALLLEHLEADDHRAEPLAYLLRRVAPQALDAALLGRALALKDNGRFAEAERMLSTLARGDGASPEALYQAAVVSLRASPKSMGRAERAAAACLRRFDGLVDREELPLVARLEAERCLAAEDFFYLGFHFAEQLGARRELGGALLQHVIALSPRAAVATRARNKLRLEGFPLDAPKPPAKGRSRTATKPRGKRT